jgi:hypothetical protein
VVVVRASSVGLLNGSYEVMLIRNCVHSFHVFKAPLLSMPPSISLPEVSEESNPYGDLWLQYPSSTRPVPVNYGHTFIAIAEFRAIVNDIATVFFIKAERPATVTINRIQGICVRLDSWHRNLPTGSNA